MSGCPELGLPALGGLFDLGGTPDLTSCDIANTDLLEAMRALSVVDDERSRSKRPVDYRHLGSEELGSVYESLLELHPQFTPDPPTFVLTSVSGHERKTTGSYYTPMSLITCLLDSALDPVLDEAAAKAEPERAILNLKVCDPLEPIEGDDKRLCKAFKKQNKEERQGQGDLFADLHPWERLGDMAAALAALDTLPDDTAEQVRTKERQYEKLIAEGNYRTPAIFSPICGVPPSCGRRRESSIIRSLNASSAGWRKTRTT